MHKVTSEPKLRLPVPLVANRQSPRLLLGKLHDPARVSGRCRQRLLAQDMQACVESYFNLRCVLGMRGRNHNRIHVGPGNHRFK